VSAARDAQDALLLLSGSTLLTVGFTDLHLRYVKPEMQPLIIGAGLVLVALGLSAIRSAFREVVTPAEPSAGGGGHALHPSSYLLVLPLLVLSLVGPPSLGSFAAARSETRVIEPVELAPLPDPVDGAVEITLTEYYSRVLYDDGSLDGVRVRLTGFVTPDEGRWFVTRMALSCCAADGRPIKVLTTGPGAESPPPADTWIEVEGTVAPSEKLPGQDVGVATLAVDSIVEVEPPAQQYE
jgi:uncharacterized repeat protein (TIGR03943 family)